MMMRQVVELNVKRMRRKSIVHCFCNTQSQIFSIHRDRVELQGVIFHFTFWGVPNQI